MGVAAQSETEILRRSSVTADPPIPTPATCVVRDLLDARARELPGKVFAIFEDGESLTYAMLREKVRTVAANLAALGVVKGDCVLCWLPNGRDSLCLMLASNYLGAVFAPLNTEYQGTLLANAIRASGAKVMVAHAILVDRLRPVDSAHLETLIVIGGSPAPLRGLQVLGGETLYRPADLGNGFPPETAPWDVHALIFTSGTTGPSKAVPITYLHSHSSSQAFVALTGEDRALLNLPMFHVGGMGLAYRMLLRGGSVAVVTSFRSQDFWDTVRRFEITNLTLLGAMVSFLLGTPPSDRDREHPLRHVIMVPISAQTDEFVQRFGVDVYTVFNMTEVACPIVSERNPALPGACGKARKGFELRVVDDNDCELAPGQAGELVVRADVPWTIATGYLGNADATAAAWRNGWFHTGDRFRRDDEGNYYFIDRLKDAIRRRGENISAFEVENEVRAYPGVLENAVVAVPSEHGEDEVLVAIEATHGAAVEPALLLEFLRDRLPGFMVPRYVRLMQHLPRTPSQKIMKYRLREEGITPDTWDRERAGIQFKRTQFAVHS